MIGSWIGRAYPAFCSDAGQAVLWDASDDEVRGVFEQTVFRSAGPNAPASVDDFLERLVPHEPTSQYRHNDTGEDNADAHIKRQVMGREVVVAITNGKLDFGPWEQIFYGEFDGRRKKRVLVKIIGE